MEKTPWGTMMFLKSKRAENWAGFAGKVAEHIDNYTVPQYGDEGSDQASEWSPDMLVEQARKYINRYGKQRRKGEEKLDLIKAAHYIQMAHDKLGE